MAMMGEDVLEGLQENIHQIGHIQFADYPNRHEPDTGNILCKFLTGYVKVTIKVILVQNTNLNTISNLLHGKKILFQ
jgi:hypothetical protein